MWIHNAKRIAKPHNPLKIAAFTIKRMLNLFAPTYYDNTENAIYSQNLAQRKTNCFAN